VPLKANSVVTLLANSRGWSSWRVVFSLARNFTGIVFNGWIYCIEIFFTFSWKTEFAVKFFIVLNIFFTIHDFLATLRLPWKTEFALKFLTVLSMGRWGTVDSFLHFQLLLLYFKTKQVKICHTIKQLCIHNIMPKHENNALQKKFYNQFKKGTFSVECAPCLGIA